MDKLCINCDTENPADAVSCSECGTSLTRTPTGVAAIDLEKEMAGAKSVVMSTEPASTRLRDMARVLALVYAGCSTLYVAGQTGIVLEMNSGVPAVPFCLSYAALPILFPWATVFIAWRWPAIGGIMLMAGGLLYLVEANTMAALGRPTMCSVLPALLGLLPMATGVLILVDRLSHR